MPDLDQLFDSLVADVVAGTRAPGVSTAITRARRRRATGVAAAAAAVALIAVGGSFAAGTLGEGPGQPAPIGEPTTPSPTQAPESAPEPGSPQELDALLADGPGWGVLHGEGYPDGYDLDGYDYAFNGRCAGDWRDGAISGHDGGVTPAADVGHGGAGFRSEAKASHAAAELVENLSSCTKAAWRTQPIGSTGAVLASSPYAVTWVVHNGTGVDVLQASTTDGPPPSDVQAAVAEWLVAYDTWQQQR